MDSRRAAREIVDTCILGSIGEGEGEEEGWLEIEKIKIAEIP